MNEIRLFGWLLATLPAATSVVLVLVSLTSVTYLATTLFPVLGASPEALGRARALGLGVAAISLLAAALGLRVGGLGSGGELVPSLAVGVAAAAALGATSAFAALGARRAARALAAARAGRRAALEGARGQQTKLLMEARRAFLAGDDLGAEAREAEASLARLGEALDELAATDEAAKAKLAALDEGAAAGDLGVSLRRAREEVATKLQLGRRIHAAAAAAAFRIACTVPLRRLLRRRPRDLASGIDAQGGPAALAALTAASEAIAAFLAEVGRTRDELATIEARRPAAAEPAEPGDPGEALAMGASPAGPGEDPWAQSMRDLAAIEGAYGAVEERLSVVAVRVRARAGMEAVASAAGEVSDKARASGIPAEDLSALVDEVTRAESAILMATPPDLDARSLSEALSRGAAALGGSGSEGESASLDELLQALREVV